MYIEGLNSKNQNFFLNDGESFILRVQFRNNPYVTSFTISDKHTVHVDLALHTISIINLHSDIRVGYFEDVSGYLFIEVLKTDGNFYLAS